jgi:hypothetical protein
LKSHESKSFGAALHPKGKTRRRLTNDLHALKKSTLIRSCDPNPKRVRI